MRSRLLGIAESAVQEENGRLPGGGGERSSVECATRVHSRRGTGSMGTARNLWALVVSVIAAVLMVGVTIVPVASASEGCENEARRTEQGSTFLPDCRAYELVSLPYQPTPKMNLFQSGEGVPWTEPTEVYNFTEYSPEPERIPAVKDSVSTALNGNAALFKAWTANSEAWQTEAPINLSRRGADGWIGENIMPPESEHAGYGCYGSLVEGFSPNLEQIAIRLGGGGYSELGEDYAHCGHDEPYLVAGESEETANLLVRGTAAHSWQLASVYPPGVRVWASWASGREGDSEYSQYEPQSDAVSADGSHVVFRDQAQLTSDAPNGETVRSGSIEGHCAAEFGNVYVSSAGADHVLTVPPDGIPVRGTLAGAHAGGASTGGGCLAAPQQTAGFTDPVSGDGERILFYSGGGFKLEPSPFSPAGDPGPRAPYIDGGLYLREHPGAGQSALAHGGAAGSGTFAAGSNTVASLLVTLASGIGTVTAGSNEVTHLATTTGEFRVGQAIEGGGVPAGTTITGFSEKTGAKETIPTVILSNNAIESVGMDKLTATSEGPVPFAAGQTIIAKGVPAGTTITAVAPGSLTLSAPASASGTAVSLEASSGCTEAEQACTVQIDAPEAGGSGSAGEGQFQWANAETTKIFFTDEQRLTSDASAESGKPDLYEYDVDKPQGQRLTDLTTDAAESADVLGVSGVSEDGSYVYFVAKGVLSGNQENSHGAKAVAGEANLYLSHAGTIMFIATLNAQGGDQCDWTAWCLTSRVSQNGAYIAFNSIDSLTGYDNRPLKPTACNYMTSGQPHSSEEAPCMEAFRYAAQSGADGELTCATCNPNGRPESQFAWSVIAQAAREGPSVYGYQIRINHPISNSGEFFFETMDKLVPADENETWDVYEYSGGEGPSAQFHLISSGKSETPSEFLDATADGSNVFFVTNQSLLRADTRSGYDIYDARVGGGFVSQSEAVQPPSCDALEACRSPLSEPPAEFSAGSAALFGGGNLAAASQRPAAEEPAKKPTPAKGLTRKQRLERALKACAKRYRHKPKALHGCERQAHKRYGASTSSAHPGSGRVGK